MLSKDQFQMCLPKKMRNRVDTEVMAGINTVLADPNLGETFRENMLSYASVLAEGRFKIASYVDAIKFCTYRFIGDYKITAYCKTFPDKYAKFKAEGVSDKDISRYVTAYSKSKLVLGIQEQAMIPTHLLNADTFQQAINVQASIMNDDDASFKVRSDAANSLLTHLKAPEVKKIELDIGVGESDVLKELRDTTLELAAQQRQMIQAGAMTAKDIAHSSIIPAEYVEVIDE